jgi:hypothetical protein
MFQGAPRQTLAPRPCPLPVLSLFSPCRRPARLSPTGRLCPRQGPLLTSTESPVDRELSHADGPGRDEGDVRRYTISTGRPHLRDAVGRLERVSTGCVLGGGWVVNGAGARRRNS